MRIQVKLVLVELVLVAGLLLTLGVVSYFTNNIIQLKDFQLESGKVVTAMENLDFQNKTLLTSNAALREIRMNWEMSVWKFDKAIKNFQEFTGLEVLRHSQREGLKRTIGLWNEIYQHYYTPALTYMQEMESRPVAEALGNDSIARTLFLMEIAEDPPAYIGDLYTLRNYQEEVIDRTDLFLQELVGFSNQIDTDIQDHLQNRRGLSVTIIVVTLGISLMVSSGFSRMLGQRIRKVEQAIRNMAAGNFSDELDIKSGDEFEELSRNYNILKTQLQEKLNSVLDFMLTIASSLEGGPRLQEVLAIIVQSAAENTEADGAAIYLVDSENKSLIPQSIIGDFYPPFPLPDGVAVPEEERRDYLGELRIAVGEGVLGRVIERAEPLFLRDEKAWEEASRSDRVIEGVEAPGSLIITPLTISHRILGAVVLTRKGGAAGSGFTDLDFTHMQTFADYAALTIDNLFSYEELIEKREMSREIEIAASIQKGLLPQRLPVLKKGQLHAFSRAARGISGDYYDTFPLGPGRIGVVICDVVGKGVPASLLMVMIRTIIRLVAAPGRSPAQLLTYLNRGIIDKIGTDHFATLSIYVYDEIKSEVTYSNAAHLPLLLYRPASGEFTEFDTPGLPIGVEKEETYSEKTFKVRKDDLLVVYTDGIPENRSRDGREFTTESLKNRLKLIYNKPARDICRIVQEDLDSFSEGLRHDDQTLVAMKVR